MWINLNSDQLDLVLSGLDYAATNNRKSAPELLTQIRSRQKSFAGDEADCISSLTAGIVYGEEGSDFQSVAFEKLDALTDGSIHYDQDTIVAKDGKGGAYVMGWIHVSAMEMEDLDVA
jgi:hypothetical protein